MLGSRSALCAVHGGVRGVYEVHGPAVLPAHVQQGRLRRADRGVRRLAGHRGLRQELRVQVLDRELVEVADDGFGPFAGGVLPLPGGLLVDLRGLGLCLPVALGLRLASGGTAAGHLLLVTGEAGGGGLAVLGMREVVGVAGGGRGFLHSPVDADHPAGGRQGLGGGRHDERGVPVAEAVAVDADGGRRLGQVPRPHHTQRDPAREVQAAAFEAEPALRVVQRRVGRVLLLALRHPGPLVLRQPGLDVLQGLGAGRGEVADDLLLRHRTALAQPRVRGAGLGQHLVEAGRAALLLVGVRLLRPGAALVPDPPAARPLRLQRGAGGRRHAEPIGVPDVSGILGILQGRDATTLLLR